MTAIPATAWPRVYEAMARNLPLMAQRARPLVAGFAACVDRRIDLHDAAPALSTQSDPRARGFYDELMNRAAVGRGGEMLADWPDGPAFLDPFTMPDGMAVGGTSAQAAWTLARLGAPSLIALDDRSGDQLAVLDPAIGIIERGEATACGKVAPRGAGKLAHYIIEYTAGRPLPGLVPRRSTRIIVRFADENIETDEGFIAYTGSHGSECGAALLASPNALPLPRLAPVLDRLAGVTTAWRASGIDLVHLELGHFVEPGALELTLRRLGGRANSLGLNFHELCDLAGDEAAPTAANAVALGERWGFDRVVVHADHWALTASRNDPRLELDALIAGCLVASARAAAGRPATRPQIPQGAVFAPPPLPAISTVHDGWLVACCAAPFLAQPASTVGLGDSFCGGSLLVHSIPNHRPFTEMVLRSTAEMAATEPAPSPA